MGDSLDLCVCEVPDPYVKGVGVTGCRRCSGYVKAKPREKGGEGEASCDNISLLRRVLSLERQNRQQHLRIQELKRELTTRAASGQQAEP